jgi:hypothetical protein
MALLGADASLFVLINTSNGSSMPGCRINDVKHWRHRAAEMRALSDVMTDTEAAAIMLRLVDDCGNLADRALVRLGYLQKKASEENKLLPSQRDPYVAIRRNSAFLPRLNSRPRQTVKLG